MPRWVWVALAGGAAATALSAVACGGATALILTPAQIRGKIASRVPPDQAATLEIPFEIDDDIRAFARKATRGVSGDENIADALMHAMVDHSGLYMQYDQEANKTARQVFRDRRGNCLAFANLFVGMARALGLDAVYVEETTVENSIRESDLIVRVGHVAGGVRSADHLLVIDFNVDARPLRPAHKPIDDLEAMAHFYNNEAYLHGFREGDAGAAVRWYRLVLGIDPRFYPAHNNLGVALKLQGRLADAVREYKLAIAADPNFAEARANLGAALAAEGRRDEALHQFRLAIRSNPQSAPLRHQRGLLLREAQRYQDAEKSFREALRRDPTYAPAAVDLGEALLAQGSREEALSAFRRALKIDPANALAQRRADELAARE